MLFMTITQYTRAKDMFVFHLDLNIFSTVRARIWNAVIVKFNVNISLFRIKESLKQYLLSNISIISYPKYIFNVVS